MNCTVVFYVCVLLRKDHGAIIEMEWKASEKTRFSGNLRALPIDRQTDGQIKVVMPFCVFLFEFYHCN